jgi:oligo-1,6-glucosidase
MQSDASHGAGGSSEPQPKSQVLIPRSGGKPWWTETVVYQIYPRSFQDTNGDGIGDLAGIIEKLDYLKSLGVGTLWLSPVFASPNDDNGYDISDYDAIHPDFGTMADFQRLLDEAHARDLRVILDLVVNHTSDEHPWFRESRSSRDNPKRDFYYWHPGRSGGPPNNWEAFFKGSAWELDEATGEYYLHLFSRKQPDLNWTNPEVRREIYQMMHRWLQMGLDGFRLDVINFIAKAPDWPDAAEEGNSSGLVFGGPLYANQPGIHNYLQEMNAQVLRHYDVMAVGECHFLNPQVALDYVAPERRELNLVFQFDIPYESNRCALLGHVDRWYEAFQGRATNTVTLSNHDTPRLVSKFGDPGIHRERSAKVYGTFLLTAPGVPFLYQGEELGMTNVRFGSIAEYRDIEMLNRHKALVAEGLSEEEALDRLAKMCRDNARTPMQWSGEAGAGFTTGTPWIGINPNYAIINAVEQETNPDSVLNYYRSLLAVRANYSALRNGEYTRFETGIPSVFFYERRNDRERFWVLLNLSSEAVLLDTSPPNAALMKVILGNITTDGAFSVPLKLAPWEARVYRNV